MYITRYMTCAVWSAGTDAKEFAQDNASSADLFNGAAAAAHALLPKCNIKTGAQCVNG